MEDNHKARTVHPLERIRKDAIHSLPYPLQSQSTTDGECIKEMKKEVEELRKKLKERGTIEANRAFEMEELEINLRASVEELQAKVCVDGCLSFPIWPVETGLNRWYLLRGGDCNVGDTGVNFVIIRGFYYNCYCCYYVVIFSLMIMNIMVIMLFLMSIYSSTIHPILIWITNVCKQFKILYFR